VVVIGADWSITATTRWLAELSGTDSPPLAGSRHWKQDITT
jgi:hypothetical protein